MYISWEVIAAQRAFDLDVLTVHDALTKVHKCTGGHQPKEHVEKVGRKEYT